MKKILALAIAVIGFGMAAQAQLLYQWAFTNVTDTVSNSTASYAFTPGTGNIQLINVSGDVFSAGPGADGINAMLYFTNANTGPGFGPGVDATGALVANGQGYSGAPTAVALATNLNLGNQFQITVTFWAQLSPAVASQFPRLVQVAQSPAYDIGNKGAGNHSDIGASINNSGGLVQEQNSVASATGAQGTATPVTGLSNFPGGLPADGSTWIFEAISYDGTLTSTNFVSWFGTLNQSVQPIVYSANYGPINFTTNATVMIGGNDVPSAPRALAYGAIADVRIYSGILASNDVEKIRTFQVLNTSNQTVTPASVVIQPASGKSFTGGTRSFNVLATGNPNNFSYLWRSNSIPIAGATNASLTLSNLALSANAASFVCSVSNVVGGTNSLPAILNVLAPPAQSYAAAVVAQNPYSFWLMNEPTNSTPITISDYANGHDGTALDPVNMQFLAGPVLPPYPGFSTANTGIETLADFAASRLNMADPVNFPNTGMTICGWIYTPGQPAANGLMFDLVSDTAGGFGLVFSGANTVSYQWGANPPASGFVGGTFSPNEWTFVALVISTNLTPADLANAITADTNATVYVGAHSIGLQSATDSTVMNGDIIGSGTSASIFAFGRTASAASDNGSFYAANTVAFNSVAVFYSALSPQTITNLYLKGAGIYLYGTPDQSTAGNLLLTYPLGTLQHATTLTGAYSDVIDPNTTQPPVSPYSIPMTNSQNYFRLRQ